MAKECEKCNGDGSFTEEWENGDQKVFFCLHCGGTGRKPLNFWWVPFALILLFIIALIRSL